MTWLPMSHEAAEDVSDHYANRVWSWERVCVVLCVFVGIEMVIQGVCVCVYVCSMSLDPLKYVLYCTCAIC